MSVTKNVNEDYQRKYQIYICQVISDDIDEIDISLEEKLNSSFRH